jgi:hypothetical protein
MEPNMAILTNYVMHKPTNKKLKVVALICESEDGKRQELPLSDVTEWPGQGAAGEIIVGPDGIGHEFRQAG